MTTALDNSSEKNPLRHQKIRFVLGMAYEFCLVGKMKKKDAIDLALSTYRQMPLWIGPVKFGDPAYDWSLKGGREAAHFLEMDYW